MSTTGSLPRRIARVRVRIRAGVLAHGAACLFAVVVGLGLSAAVADRAVHLDNPALRVGILAGLIAAAVAVGWRYLIAPLLLPLSDTAIAMRIERQHPQFEERLASSLQFLAHGRNPSLGSPELQQRVISETLERASGVDFAAAVPFSPVMPAVGVAAAIGLTALALACYAPQDAAIAVWRLAAPYSAPAWPRRNDLRLLSTDLRPIDMEAQPPFTVVRGRKLELLVEDENGRLPEEVTLEYRFAGEPTLRETLRHLPPMRDRSGQLHDVCLLSLPAERGPVWFRATAGDDDTMSEFELRVVLPPVVETLQVTVSPPRYTGRPATALASGDGRIHGMLGTRVTFEARTSKPLSSAAVFVKDKAAGETRILEDRRAFRGSFTLSEPGASAWWFRLKDVEGVENVDPPRYEIDAVADAAPDVVINDPAADETVTADAEVPLSVSAKDDGGLRDMRLCFHVGDSGDAHAVTVPLAANLPRPLHHRIRQRWRLAGLAPSEGMRIVFHAEASDWYDLGPPHLGKSAPRTLTIVSAKQKEMEILSRQADLLRLLERSEQSQARTREQTTDLDVQLDKAGRLKPSDLDVLTRIESDQRQVHRLLANPADGAGVTVRGLLEELKANHVPVSGTQRRLERFDRELTELRDAHLPVIDDRITRAVKSAEIQGPSADRAAAREQSKALKTARSEQGIVLESLKTMLGDLAQWRDWQDLHDGLHDLIEGQEKLNRDTADVSRGTLARPLSELAPQEQADLARLGERQAQLAEQLERIRNRLRETAKGLDPSHRDAADAANAALKAIERSDPASQMREIGGQIAKNNVGQAMARQQQLLDELRKLDQGLAQRPEGDMQSLVARMGEAQQKLDTLQKEQEVLRKKTQDLNRQKPTKPPTDELERLQKEQARVREKADEAARELRRLGAEPSGDRLRDAAEHMSRAEDLLDRSASVQTDSEQRQAIEELERARSELAETKRQAEQHLARQSLVRMADQLGGLAGRQKSILDETARLEAERSQQNHWTRGQLRSLQTTARLEQHLRDETTGIAKQLQEADVYAWVLGRAAERMAAAGQRLQDRQTDAQTVALETEAWSRLRDLIAALKRESGSNSRSQVAKGSPENADGSDGIPQVAQLELLKTMEQDLLRRTGEFDRKRQDAAQSTTAALNRELAQLTAEQGELATLFERLANQVFPKPAAEKPATQPLPKTVK